MSTAMFSGTLVGYFRGMAVAALLMTGPGCRSGELPRGVAPTAPPTSAAAEGRRLYLLNCAHCHAEDATGDEGPDLHDVAKSDARIAQIIEGGIKFKMPKFRAKLSEANVRALIAYLRSLRASDGRQLSMPEDPPNPPSVNDSWKHPASFPFQRTVTTQVQRAANEDIDPS